MASLPDYAELHCLSNFSFLRGASHPEELIERAAALGYKALALTDECSLAGVVRAHAAAKEHKLKLIVGTEIAVEKEKLVLLATDRRSYGAISSLITAGRRRGKKGSYSLSRSDVESLAGTGTLVLWAPQEEGFALWLRERFSETAWIAAELHCSSGDRARLERLRGISAKYGLPLTAAGDVHMHLRSRRKLQDVLTAVRLGRPLAQCGHALYPNAERHLRLRMRLAQLYPAELLAETLAIADRCRFSMDELRYEYPEELVPSGETPTTWLRHLVEEGLKKRFPGGLISEKVKQLVERELALIAELRYEPFFLTVHDVVRFAREQGILCQGRGSSANSVVCYALGITSVGPDRLEMLFERFVSKERDEPPDIDVDFEHERREEVIQYIYRKYRRERAAIAATVICYRAEERAARRRQGAGVRRRSGLRSSRPRRAGGRAARFSAPSFAARRRLRHLARAAGRAGADRERGDAGSHRHPVGQGRPRGARPAQGRRARAGHADRDQGKPWRCSTSRCRMFPKRMPGVYGMMQKADTVGVFQIESRAQMSMLPRLKPENFYDLVVQIAIVRPGPDPGRTWCIPIFAARAGSGADRVSEPGGEGSARAHARGADFPGAGDAAGDQGRGIHPGRSRSAAPLHGGMEAKRRAGEIRRQAEGRHASERGYAPEFADAIYRQICGFGEYGFPESHSASFALLAYASAWIKRHHPAVFCAALLNSQPMGFYQPAQLVQDARRHGVEVRPPDVNRSDWDCTLEDGALRLGLRMVAGLPEISGRRIAERRPYASVAELDLNRKDLRCLAAAGALQLARRPSAPGALGGGRSAAQRAPRRRLARAAAAARAAERRAGHRRRLRQSRPDPRPAPARPAARTFKETANYRSPGAAAAAKRQPARGSRDWSPAGSGRIRRAA